jgi:hypothetical protein
MTPRYYLIYQENNISSVSPDMFARSGRVGKAPTGTNKLKCRMLRQHFSPGPHSTTAGCKSQSDIKPWIVIECQMRWRDQDAQRYRTLTPHLAVSGLRETLHWKISQILLWVRIKYPPVSVYGVSLSITFWNVAGYIMVCTVFSCHRTRPKCVLQLAATGHGLSVYCN